jgi:hypothetical protein
VSGGSKGLGRTSPGSSRPQFVHWTFDQSVLFPKGGELESIPFTQSTSVGTPPVRSL